MAPQMLEKKLYDHAFLFSSYYSYIIHSSNNPYVFNTYIFVK